MLAPMALPAQPLLTPAIFACRFGGEHSSKQRTDNWFRKPLSSAKNLLQLKRRAVGGFCGGQGASMCSLIRSISTSGRYLIGRRCGRCRRGRLPLVLGLLLGFVFCLSQTKQFLHRKDPVRAVLAEPLEVEIFDEYGQGNLPRFLLVVVDLAELPRVHPQFPSHLDVGMRQVVASASIDPGLYCRIG